MKVSQELASMPVPFKRLGHFSFCNNLMHYLVFVVCWLFLTSWGSIQAQPTDPASMIGEPETTLKPIIKIINLAEQGNAQAQDQLGFMYAHGRGVPQDDTEAARWFKLAAEQGLDEAQFNLGFAYANGYGVPKNLVKAYAWTNLATAQGYEGAKDLPNYHLC